MDGFGAAHGAFGLQWAQNSPANDNFASPETISGANGKDYSTNVRSTGEPGEPTHASIPDRTVWYTWTAPETGTAILNTREANFDTTLAAYTGTSITGLTQLASNDEFNGDDPVQGDVRGHGRHHVPDRRGRLRRRDRQRRAAMDDQPAGERRLRQRDGLSGPYGSKPASTVRATGEPGELDYHGGAIADNSVWFKWTPGDSAPSVVRLLNVAGGLLPGIGVYTGSEPRGADPVGTGATSAQFNAVAGTQYLIAVDGNSGSTGTFSLEFISGKCNGLNATIFAAGGTTTGTAGNDVIVGSTIADTINGGGGNDTICSAVRQRHR